MNLNGVMAIILFYFAEFGRFRGQLLTKHDGRAVLFAVAELFVLANVNLVVTYF